VVSILSRELLEQAYKQEKDPDVKERLLLVLRVKYDGVSAAQAARELHRTKPWASKLLKKFELQGLEGLKTAPRSGRQWFGILFFGGVFFGLVACHFSLFP